MTIVHDKIAAEIENGKQIGFPGFLHRNIMRGIRYEKWRLFILGGFVVAGGGVISSVWYGWSTLIETGTADILRDIWGELSIDYDMLTSSVGMVYDDLSLATMGIFAVSILVFSWLLSVIINQSIRRSGSRMHYTLTA